MKVMLAELGDSDIRSPQLRLHDFRVQLACNPRGERQRGSARGQMRKSIARKFHRFLRRHLAICSSNAGCLGVKLDLIEAGLSEPRFFTLC
jgi:hypothetical protein